MKGFSLFSAFLEALPLVSFKGFENECFIGEQEMYMDALSLGAKLLKELKKLDDKNLLVEVSPFELDPI